VPLFRDGPPSAVADGDDRVKIVHLLAAVAPGRVDFLARLHDQPSNRPVPRGTGGSRPGRGAPLLINIVAQPPQQLVGNHRPVGCAMIVTVA
jgi:hypothetical protein